MAQKLTANRSSAREARGLVEQMTFPTPRPPWPARGPLGRLREARQGPAGSHEGRVRPTDLDGTRVNLLTV